VDRHASWVRRWTGAFRTPRDLGSLTGLAPLAHVHPGQQILDTETKLIHHAIRIAAYNTAQSLARAIAADTGYSRADDEAHTLIRTALAGSGDIIPDPTTNTLHIRLDPT